MILRPYQSEVVNQINDAHSVAKNVCATLPTGAGKTVIFSWIMKHLNGFSCAIVHRQELLLQMSMTLAKLGVFHRIYASKPLKKIITELQFEEFGRVYLNASSNIAVASVGVMGRYINDHFFRNLSLWVVDEAHHLLTDNSWGKVINALPEKCKGLGVTATPERADGKGIGADAQFGVFDELIVGPTLGDLIALGYLTDYKIYAPLAHFNAESLKVGGSGDFTKKSIQAAFRESHIVGDIVGNYFKLAKNQLTVAFTPSVEMGKKLTNEFNYNHIKASFLSAKTGAVERHRELKKFKEKETIVLVNVDLFGEGFDLPSMEAAIFARPTASYGLYTQQFGRPLRPLKGKTVATIIDHVGNTLRHGLPTHRSTWSMDDKKKKTKKDTVIEIKACPQCFNIHERYLSKCPHCGYVADKKVTNTEDIKIIDGDLELLTEDALKSLYDKINYIRTPPENKGKLKYLIKNGNSVRATTILNRSNELHKYRMQALDELVAEINRYGFLARQKGLNDRDSKKLFYLTFGFDVLTAQTLSYKEMIELKEKIRKHNIDKFNSWRGDRNYAELSG